MHQLLSLALDAHGGLEHRNLRLTKNEQWSKGGHDNSQSKEIIR